MPTACPQTIAVLATRLAPLGITLDVVDLGAGAPTGDYFGVVQQYPGCSGSIRDFEALTAEAHAKGALVTVATDLLALTLLKPPGEWGADVAVGSSQRFGVPLWYGGPARGLHGRQERTGARSARTPRRALDRRGGPSGLPAGARRRGEQHIRREKATSNICTAQVLLAVVASMYAVYHGAEGLRGIARRVHRRAADLAAALQRAASRCVHREFFDTVVVEAPGRAAAIVDAAGRRGVLLRLVDDDHVGISCGETTTAAHVEAVLEAFGVDGGADARPRRAPCPRRSCAGARSSPTPSSRSTTPRRRCSATCAACRTRTSRSIAA